MRALDSWGAAYEAVPPRAGTGLGRAQHALGKVRARSPGIRPMTIAPRLWTPWPRNVRAMSEWLPINALTAVVWMIVAMTPPGLYALGGLARGRQERRARHR